MLYHLSYAAVIFFRRDYSGGGPICQLGRGQHWVEPDGTNECLLDRAPAPK